MTQKQVRESLYTLTHIFMLFMKSKPLLPFLSFSPPLMFLKSSVGPAECYLVITRLRAAYSRAQMKNDDMFAY